MSSCPTKLSPWVWGVLRLWASWSTFGGLPEPGSLSEQNSWLLEAFEVLNTEQALIQMAHRAEERSKRRR